jgi:uroporphyrinogen-III synthase
MPAMRIALIARPRWESDPAGPSHAARLIDAPLQLLTLCDPQPQAFEALGRTTHPWIVFTSPASVQAMDRWIAHTGINPMQWASLRLAAVGSGTRAAIIDVSAQHAVEPSCAWPLDHSQIIVSANDERADAAALLQSLDAEQQRLPFAWQDQTFLLAQGQANRPTLADGLAARGAHVIPLAMYRRQDVSWPAAIWQMIGQAGSGECGVVVTSSTVIARLMADLAAHGVDPAGLAWCTQHAAIAEKLRAHGLARVRRVSLQPASLEGDLFEHEHDW